MSVWKKASKINQKVHRERHQPEARKRLGLLEKHKDYVQRAKDYNDKQATLKLLHKRALNKNPDEFYYHMINSKLQKGVHHELKKKDEDTLEQQQLMQTQDLKYIGFKRFQEFKKIERLQAQLHLTSINCKKENNHIYFSKNLETVNKNKRLEYLVKAKLPDIDVNVVKKVVKKRKGSYMELAKRVKREHELSIVQQKLEIKRHIDSKKNVLKPVIVKKGSKTAAPVYKWKYERKR